jgi:hypothetical protein
MSILEKKRVETPRITVVPQAYGVKGGPDVGGLGSAGGI